MTSDITKAATVFTGENPIPVSVTLSVILLANRGGNGSKGSCMPKV